MFLNMASLLVKLHELVESYVKNAKEKDVAGKIGSEILERSRQVIKKHKFTPEDACVFHITELYPIVSRELHRILTIVRRRLKSRTTLSHPWSIRILRNMPTEIFELLKETILVGNYGIIAKKTHYVELLHLSHSALVTKWLKRVIGHTSPSLKEPDVLLKVFKDGSYCKAIIMPEHPLVIKYSKSQETIQFFIRYGCWNTFGIAQHVL